MSDMSTPRLVVDEHRLRANIARMAELATAAGLAMRPHVKTHKSVDIARLQIEAGATGITVATIGEAEVFAAAGFDDIFIGYPLWIDDEAAKRLRRLSTSARVAVGVDHATGAHKLAGLPVDVLIEIDSGHRRSGCQPQDARAVAEALGRAPRGIFTFPGHSYSPEARVSAARDEVAALRVANQELGGVEVISGGSTPSIAATLADPQAMTEIRPGVYVFGDAQQWELGSCSPDDIALTCEARVISHAGGRLVLDAGSKILGADRAAYASGFGRLLDHPDARIVLLSEHHSVAVLDGVLPALGSTVRVVPNHVCNAVNLVEALTVGDQEWPVSARGRNG